MDIAGFEALAARAGLLWLSADAQHWQAVWFGWHEGAAHVVVDGTEQPAPPAGDSDEHWIRLPSKDTRAVAALARATAVTLAPGTSAWREAAEMLAAKRLNGTGGDLVERWATGSRLIRLELIDVAAEAGNDEVGGRRPVSIEPLRPKKWRPMRGHARAGSARARPWRR